ncbi:hypothetical protein [Enterobacter hormaechei]|uniref:hypothetical protein n=1 Tax=Enterobacter hormaechei TaxID=158836 RepID=UPI002A750523|nr:hypothetical protein [Enterobacter hormaechei]MDY3572426.1 hypothetical protein [Enterobacter hormaechei]
MQNKLYLSDGRVFSLVKNRNGGTLSFQNPQPVDCIIKSGSDNRMQVVHKNDTIEVFESLSRVDAILSVERIISPEGFSLYLE